VYLLIPSAGSNHIGWGLELSQVSKARPGAPGGVGDPVYLAPTSKGIIIAPELLKTERLPNR